MNSSRRAARVAIAACAVVAVVGSQMAPAAAGRNSGSTQTAQAIWTNFKPSGNDELFGYTETETYAFDVSAAETYYARTETGPVRSCTGGATNCADTNAPTSVPSQPVAPSFAVPRDDECTFWTGGELSTVSQTKSVTVNGANGRGNWTYTWTYTWTPVASPIGDDTGVWAVISTESEGGATITFTAQIAGLSAQKTSRASAPKYSFSMTNPDGTPRVANVFVSVDGGTPEAVGSTVVSALDEAFADFGVGAGQGLSTLMASGGATGILTTGDARTILNTDSFLGNNNGGSDGKALAYVQLEAIRITLTDGTYAVVLSAQIKGIDGSADVNVEVERDVRVQGLGGCANA